MGGGGGSKGEGGGGALFSTNNPPARSSTDTPTMAKSNLFHQLSAGSVQKNQRNAHSLAPHRRVVQSKHSTKIGA